MEIPDIVRCLAALLPAQDQVCLALVSRTCYNALPGVLASHRGYGIFHLAASKGSFRQAYWWLSDYTTRWTEDDAQLILRRLGERQLTKKWPLRFLSIFSEEFHSMEDCVIEGCIEKSTGDIDKLLEYVEELLWNVCQRRVDWYSLEDDDDAFSRKKLQMIITFAAEQNVAVHHNIAQRFGIDFPETRLG